MIGSLERNGKSVPKMRNEATPAHFGADHQEMLEINERLVVAGVRQQEFAEVALRAEQRLRDLLHGLDAVICEVELQTGRPSFLSLQAETFLGHPLDRWRSQPDFLAEIVHPDDRERVAGLFPAFLEARQDYEYEFRALSDDSEWVWMRNIVRLVYSAAGAIEMLRCVIVDATVQKQAALALEGTARELEAAYKRERNITETLQRSLLFMPPENSFPGLAVKTLYEAASDSALVGGDFWDTFACDHGHIALVLGDVMGHGLPAAMFTAELKYVLRAFVREHEQPGRILEQMNNYLCEGHRLYGEGLNAEGDDAPVCLTIAIFDTATGQARVAGGGMEPPLLVRRDGSMEEIKVNGLLLGFQPGTEYKETAFQLGRGDLIILTTDGVTEVRQDKQFLGYDGLMRLVREAQPSGTLEKMGRAILDGAREFAHGTLKDDACVLLGQRR